MTHSERFEKVMKIEDTADRIFAKACHYILRDIELTGYSRVAGPVSAERYQKGIKKFFDMDVNINDSTISL